MKYSQILSILKEMTSSHKKLFFRLILVVAVSIIASLIPPLILAQVVNHLTARTGNALFYFLCGLVYFAVQAVSGLSDAARQAGITAFGQEMAHAIRSAMSRKLKKLPASWFIKKQPGETASLFVNDVDTIENLFDSGIISMVSDLLQIIGIVAVVFYLSRGLALLLVIVLPVLFWLTVQFQKRMLRAQMDQRSSVAATNEWIPETIKNIRTIHLCHGEPFMKKKYGQTIRDSFKAMEKSNFYDSTYSPIILTSGAFIIGLMMILAATMPDGWTFFGMTAGTVMALITYVKNIFTPLQAIGMEIQSIQSAVAGLKRISGFLEEPEEEPGTERVGNTTGEEPVSIRDVSFGYEKEHPIIQNFNLELHQNDFVSLTGRTGCGKSTIFKLILGFYKPQKGSVRVYGRDPAKICAEDKRHTYGCVEQEFHLIQGTVLDQVTLRDPRITEQMAEEAIRAVGLEETCRRLPEGLHTPCRASTFSMGQFQLLSIARAIAMNPPLLLLDEMTAHWDALTEEKVMRAFLEASNQRTVLSISHRLWGLKKGRVVVMGKN